MIRIPFTAKPTCPLIKTFIRSSSQFLPHTLALRRVISRNTLTRSYSVDGKKQINTFDISKLTKTEIQQLRELKRARERKYKDRTVAFYFSSVAILFLGLAYAAVPLYRAICARTGFGGIPITDRRKFTDDKLIPVDTEKRIRISFTSEVSQILPWKFVPQQRQVYVLPGETALAFYKAKNNSDKDIIGMATYSIAPGEAAQYFNKIQCFCFEEQKLAAGEEIDMPVFFFIDPDFASDPAMRNIDDIILHYTFFKAHYGDGTAVSDSKKEPDMDPDEKAAALANAAILSPEVIDTRMDKPN
ncbi:cox11p [Saccharomyces arboricola H-6]|uniref:Cox11p n=1 Tax=Saccharomyces arboricola (strain H-6 / AS 2.3317 / CBS 10644) TaxID=1160507 RepID=J8PVL7_SACAR|nr:cox11p [Saccharomyces arboricola H-6]